MALSFANVKTFKPVRGIREALIDITLDSSYDNGGWEIDADDVKGYSGIAAVIYNLEPQPVAGGYSFTWDAVNGKLKALVGSLSDDFAVSAMAEYTQDPASTSTEQAAALCKVYNSTADAYENLADSADLGDDVTADYQPWPDAADEAIGDAVYFGAAVAFPQLVFTITTPAVYGDAATAWKYWNGSAWSALTLVYDGTGSTATDGTYSFEQAGTVTFVPPQDWAATTVDGQSAYWVRCQLTAVQVTTTAVFTSEHDLMVPDTGYVPTRNGLLSSIRVIDTSDVAHTAADIKFVVWNYTTGASSGEVVFPQDQIDTVMNLPHAVPVSIGDKLALVCTQEDGTNELDSGFWEFRYSNAEALANDGGLDGVVVRCRVVGS